MHGFGFTHNRRSVYKRNHQLEQLPVCNGRFGEAMLPFFQPLVVPDGAGHLYLAEGYAFCERARRAGFAIMADITIRLWHIGSWRYAWEAAGRDPEGFGDDNFHNRP